MNEIAPYRRRHTRIQDYFVAETRHHIGLRDICFVLLGFVLGFITLGQL